MSGAQLASDQRGETRLQGQPVAEVVARLRRCIPDIESIQVEVGPLLSLPPVMSLPVHEVLRHCTRRDIFGDGIQEDLAPTDAVRSLA